jgi:ABC-type transporter Mla subunit MlaD
MLLEEVKQISRDLNRQLRDVVHDISNAQLADFFHSLKDINVFKGSSEFKDLY